MCSNHEELFGHNPHLIIIIFITLLLINDVGCKIGVNTEWDGDAAVAAASVGEERQNMKAWKDDLTDLWPCRIAVMNQ